MNVREFYFPMIGAGAIPTTGNGGRFSAIITGAAPPTCQYVSAPTVAAGGYSLGAAELAMTSANEVQNVTLFQSDALGIPIDALIYAEFLVRCPVAPSAVNCIASWGLASARNADIDNIAHSMLFNMTASALVNVQCDDNVVDVPNQSTGVTLGTQWKRFGISLRSTDPGLTNKQDIQFFLDGVDGRFTRFERPNGARFSMENSTSGLQIFAQVSKGGGVGVGTIQIGSVYLKYLSAF